MCQIGYTPARLSWDDLIPPLHDSPRKLLISNLQINGQIFVLNRIWHSEHGIGTESVQECPIVYYVIVLICILFLSCTVNYCQPLCRVSSGSWTRSVEAIHILSALPSYAININNHTQLTRCCSWTVYYPTCGRKLLNLPDLFLTGVLNETRARFWRGFSTQFTLMILKGSL